MKLSRHDEHCTCSQRCGSRVNFLDRSPLGLVAEKKRMSVLSVSNPWNVVGVMEALCQHKQTPKSSAAQGSVKYSKTRLKTLVIVKTPKDPSTRRQHAFHGMKTQSRWRHGTSKIQNGPLTSRVGRGTRRSTPPPPRLITYLIATFRVARLWCRDRPSRAIPMTCPNVNNLKNPKMKRNASKPDASVSVGRDTN